ncbi:uncharacterized protein LY89DRAFT_332751 [Mollisia scopiformis]|uniref:Uncharacterized protein n=1 Tax=Mollisia scopiformis TaxID=149040 RepID=A0A132B7Z1_MOLSC|nr:uncharacterized protein LY89DRAFT_332751 [Mollisia scopiformis]KUJ08530.1 hypothetical protein LY89DRAFT_332751 [Mollisia scopiformis]
MVRWVLLQYAPISARLTLSIGWRLGATNANESVVEGKMNLRLTSMPMIRSSVGMIGDSLRLQCQSLIAWLTTAGHDCDRVRCGLILPEPHRSRQAGCGLVSGTT